MPGWLAHSCLGLNSGSLTACSYCLGNLLPKRGVLNLFFAGTLPGDGFEPLGETLDSLFGTLRFTCRTHTRSRHPKLPVWVPFTGKGRHQGLPQHLCMNIAIQGCRRDHRLDEIGDQPSTSLACSSASALCAASANSKASALALATTTLGAYCS